MSEARIVCVSTLRRDTALEVLKRTMDSISTLPEDAMLDVTFEIKILDKGSTPP